jgi:cytochrome c peroxidase
LSALYAADLLSRVPIPARCPRGIAVSPDGKHLAVASYYSGEVLLLEPDRCGVSRTINLGPQPEPDEVRHGEFVFHNGRHSFQHWLSCSTCHPDGRADGMNWDLLNDGLGNPKNAKSLLWSHKTPPAMALGVRGRMEEAAQKGFQFIQFREVEEGDLKAVQAYLRSLQPESSPHLVDGRLSEKALRGKEIFKDAKVGCSHCHPGPLFTSMELHDVGTKHELDRHASFDTPTCVELWRTGPYLHDGSAVTLPEMLTTMNPDDRHGHTSHLSAADIEALTEYLLSL